MREEYPDSCKKFTVDALVVAMCLKTLILDVGKCMRTHISGGVRPYILQLLDSLSILKFAVLMINNKNNCTLETAGHSSRSLQTITT